MSLAELLEVTDDVNNIKLELISTYSVSFCPI